MKFHYLSIVATAVISGCVMQPSVPDYTATWPDEPPETVASNGSIYRVGHDVALFENSIAHRVGDTVTIRLLESTNASKSSSTATNKASDISVAAPTGLGTQITLNGAPISLGVENETNFAGSGTSAQSNKLEGLVTVTVAKSGWPVIGQTHVNSGVEHRIS